MQTFLPYPSFAESMAVLDNRRLGNQVYREGKTLVCGGWPNHPASKMWEGHRKQLIYYCLAGITELTNRGRHYPHHYEFFNRALEKDKGSSDPPKWLGNEDFHAAHRSNLLRKDPEWYGQFGWTEPDDLPYIWPEP